MATYAELVTASQNSALCTRIAVACAVAADKIRVEPSTTPNYAARAVWARQAFADPGKASAGILWSVLAQNRTATLAQITGADDAAVQIAVEAAIDAVAVA